MTEDREHRYKVGDTTISWNSDSLSALKPEADQLEFGKRLLSALRCEDCGKPYPEHVADDGSLACP